MRTRNAEPLGKRPRLGGAICCEVPARGLRECLVRVDVEPVDPLIRTDERHLRPLRWPVAELPDRGRRGKDVAPTRTDLLPRPLACPLRHLVRELLAQEAPPVERVADRIEDRRALCLVELVCLVPRR